MEVDPSVTITSSLRGPRCVPPEAGVQVPANFLPPPGTPNSNGIPCDWAPIMARDSATLTQCVLQPPASDAYLAGQPSKRRKVLSDRKPGGGQDIQAVIKQSLQEAVEQVGVAEEAVLQHVLTDTQVQRAAEAVTK